MGRYDGILVWIFIVLLLILFSINDWWEDTGEATGNFFSILFQIIKELFLIFISVVFYIVELFTEYLLFPLFVIIFTISLIAWRNRHLNKSPSEKKISNGIYLKWLTRISTILVIYFLVAFYNNSLFGYLFVLIFSISSAFISVYLYLINEDKKK